MILRSFYLDNFKNEKAIKIGVLIAFDLRKKVTHLL